MQYDRERDRYAIHELLRQYAAEKLTEDSEREAAVCDQHSAYYCQALHEREDDLKGGRQQEALAEIESDLENVRVAWRWAVKKQQIDLLEKAMDSLGYFHEWTGHYAEGETLFHIASQNISEHVVPDLVKIKAKLIAWRSVFSKIVHTGDIAVELCKQSLALLHNASTQGIDTQHQQAFALYQLGRAGEDFGLQKDALESSLRLFRQLGDSWNIANVLQVYGSPYAWFVSFSDIEKILKECLTIRQMFGDRRGICSVLIMLSYFERYQGRFDNALQLGEEALKISHEIGSRPLESETLYNLGMSKYHLALFGEALEVFALGTHLALELGDQLGLVSTHLALGLVELSKGNMDLVYEQIAIIDDIALGSGTLTYLHGFALIVERSFDQAHERLQDALAMSLKTNNWMFAGACRSMLAIVGHLQSRVEPAQNDAYQALRIALKMQHFVIAQWSIMSVILLLDEHDLERAIEIDALTQARHPCFEHAWFWKVIRQPFTDRIAHLPTEVVEGARERGRQLDYLPTAEALLQELTEQGGEQSTH